MPRLRLKLNNLQTRRGPFISLLIGFMFCVSLWQIHIQLNSSPNSLQPNQFNSLPIPAEFSIADRIKLLPKKDFFQLIDVENFHFMKNHYNCGSLEETPIAVVLVHSAPSGFQKREVIRETWGNYDSRSLLLFLVGTVNSTEMQKKIDEEFEVRNLKIVLKFMKILQNILQMDKMSLYFFFFQIKVNGDLIQGNFFDTYQNMTYKHVMAFKWFLYNCPEVNYLLKTDDDVFVNTPLLYDVLEQVSNQSRETKPGQLLICTEINRPKVKRSFRSKWHISFKAYQEKYYPNYCSGFSILYSADVVFQIYNQTQNLPYFWIDDVQVTGFARSQLNITITPSDSLFLSKNQHTKVLNDDKKIYKSSFLFAQPDLTEQEIRKFWKNVL